jgi:curved DNA-binding protein CbpA
MTRTVQRCVDAPAVSLHGEELQLLDALPTAADEASLAAVLGMSLADVRDVVERLAMLGLVTCDAVSPDERASIDDAPAVEEESPFVLDQAQCARIDALYRDIETCDFYSLLNVARDATSTDIKHAYHRLAPEFHPDRYFRKNLGDYKVKIEAIFARATKAHDTLRYKKRRRAYDEAMPGVDMPVPGAPSSQPDSFEDADDDPSRRQATTAPHSEPEMQPGEEEQDELTPVQAERQVALARQARRAALARKLAGGRGHELRRRGAQAQTPAYQSVSGVDKSAAERLRQHFDEAGKRARERRVERQVRDGDRAMDQGDFAAAHAAYTAALQFNPGDDRLIAKLDEASRRAAE